MNEHLANPEPVSHEAVQHLLPWLLSGTLDNADRALIAPHLESCPQCQAELAWQRTLSATLSDTDTDAALDPDRAFAALLPRLGAQEAPVRVLERWRGALAANSAWLRWAALGQLAMIAILGALLVRPASHGGDYRALGAAPVARGDAVIVFKPDTSEREMRRILQASGARVIDGPTVTDAYVLALPPGGAAAALARLGAENAVTLARPLGAEEP